MRLEQKIEQLKDNMKTYTDIGRCPEKPWARYISNQIGKKLDYKKNYEIDPFNKIKYHNF